jgi:hypothetical protein
MLTTHGRLTEKGLTGRRGKTAPISLWLRPGTPPPSVYCGLIVISVQWFCFSVKLQNVAAKSVNARPMTPQWFQNLPLQIAEIEFK